MFQGRSPKPVGKGGGGGGDAERGALLSAINGNKGVGGLRKVKDSEKKDRSNALPGNYGKMIKKTRPSRPTMRPNGIKALKMHKKA